jgi:aspartate aminotransferase
LIDGVTACPAEGSFFVFADMSGVIARRGDLDDDVGLAEYLLEHAEIATVPGAAFGVPDYLRLSTANSMDTLREAMVRMRKALA